MWNPRPKAIIMIKNAIMRVRNVMMTSLKRMMYLPMTYICLMWNRRLSQAAVIVNALIFQLAQDLIFIDCSDDSHETIEYSSEATYTASKKVNRSRNSAKGYVSGCFGFIFPLWNCFQMVTNEVDT